MTVRREANEYINCSAPKHLPRPARFDLNPLAEKAT